VLPGPPGDAAGDAAASVLKLRGSQLSGRAALLAAEALGHYGIAALPNRDAAEVLHLGGIPLYLDDDEAIGVTAKAMFRRATTIYGGTSEIQRTIIAKSVLGLLAPTDFSFTSEQQSL